LVAVDGEEGHVYPDNSSVDDTTTGSKKYDIPMEPVPPEVKELIQTEECFIEKTQIIIQLFLDLLKVTGGDLAPDKCML
jgi:hypothetical protein